MEMISLTHEIFNDNIADKIRIAECPDCASPTGQLQLIKPLIQTK